MENKVWFRCWIHSDVVQFATNNLKLIRFPTVSDNKVCPIYSTTDNRSRSIYSHSKIFINNDANIATYSTYNIAAAKET